MRTSGCPELTDAPSAPWLSPTRFRLLARSDVPSPSLASVERAAIVALLARLPVRRGDDVLSLGADATLRCAMRWRPRSFVTSASEVRLHVDSCSVAVVDALGSLASTLGLERTLAEATRTLKRNGSLGLVGWSFHDERVPEARRARVRDELARALGFVVPVDTPATWQRLTEAHGLVPRFVSLGPAHAPPLARLEARIRSRLARVLGAWPAGPVTRDAVDDELARVSRAHSDVLRTIALVART